MNTKYLLLFSFLWIFSCLATAQEPADSTESKGLLQRLKDNFTSSDPKKEDVIHKYEFIHRFFHSEEQQLYDSLRQAGIDNWIMEGDTLIYAARYDSMQLASDVTVFGWHPYWMGNAYENYQFNLLSYIAWFSYDVNPLTGGARNPSVLADWKNTPIVDSAHQHDCKVLLTITSMEKDNNEIFLNDKLAQGMLMDSVIDLIILKNADGIAVNFEQISPGQAKSYTRFIKELSFQLKEKDPAYVLALSIPKINAGRIDDIGSLNEAVDLFVMTGYDYHSSASKKDGPISPLRSSRRGRSIEFSVNDYINQGVDPSKLLVGLPYYGSNWQEDGTFVRHLTYKAIKTRYETLGVPQKDRMSGSVYYQDERKDPLEIIWFEDSASLALKYDWVIQNQLGGVGLWALGYDNGQPELWSLIADKFASDSTVMYQVVSHGALFNVAQTLRKEKDVLVISGIFLIFFLVIGFVAALFDWRVREIFFAKQSYRILYITAFFTLVFLLYLTYLFLAEKAIITDPVVIISLGLFLGSLLTFQIGRRYYKWKKSLP